MRFLQLFALGFIAFTDQAVGIAAPFVPPRDAHCVAFSPDGRTVAIGISGLSNGEFPPRPHPHPGKGGVIAIYDLASQKRLRRIETFGDLTQIAFSPDGTVIAATRLYATDDSIRLNEVRLWDAATGQPRLLFDRCHGFSFAPHRPEIIVVSQKRCVVWDLVTGERLRQLPLLADSLRVAYVAGGDSVCGIVLVAEGFVLRKCDATTGELQGHSPPLEEPFYSMAVPQAGTRLATGHPRGLVFVWDVSTLKPTVRVNLGGSGRALPFFSATGELLGGADQSNSDVVIWDAATGRELSRYTFSQGAVHTSIARSANGLVRPEEDPIRFAFSPDGSSFVGGPFGGIVRLVQDGRDIARFGE